MFVENQKLKRILLEDLIPPLNKIAKQKQPSSDGLRKEDMV